ncbi:MAG TPA: DUF4037 domain-containing protein, partial [Caldilineaceae bacterium]|nr:DUF4037 domain-containing protein [Caldilineaceae bacterium]
HNYSPRVVIWVADDHFAQVGQALQQRLLAAAPSHYMGYPLLDNNFIRCIAVVPREGFFYQHLGVAAFPTTNQAWLKLNEQRLLEVTAGPIFYDPQGRLQAIIAQLAFYPDAVRYFLLRQGVVRLSEVGAIERTIRRGDYIATALYRAWFVYFAVKFLHLQQRRYCPYRKWMGRSLTQLGAEGQLLSAKLETLVRTSDLDAVSAEITGILRFLGDLMLQELGEADYSLSVESDLCLTNFHWDILLAALDRQIPEELKELSPLITPVTFWGDLFDFAGLGGDFATLLAQNLQFLQARASQ